MKLSAALLIASVSLFTCSCQVYSACSPAKILRDDVLIVVNDNSVASERVGEYYCEQRGIDPANIARVRVPATSDIHYDQFVVLRDQIIRFLQEHTLPDGTQPVSCDQTQGYSSYYCPESMDQIRQLTKIRYVILTKGIPTRFRYWESPLPGNPDAVVDNYLRFWLLNYFEQDVRFAFLDRAVDFEDGRGMRTVEPASDHELIVGRIDGVTAESAMKLVDRAIAAEKDGIFGKLYGSKFGPLAKLSGNGSYWKQWLPDGGTTAVYPSWHYLHGLFGNLQSPGKFALRHDLDPECLTYDEKGKVPQHCVTRLTSGGVDPDTSNDRPPGSLQGRIWRADTALVYQGYSDGFSSIASFADLLNWRETDDCNTLCPLDDAVCREASIDVYKEIDTRCVRVADGFIGYNFQSYPVGMMAAWPTGWFQNLRTRGFSTTGSRHYFMWPPEIRDDSGFDDNYSLWYRNPDQKRTAACYTKGDSLQGAPAAGCDHEKRVNINQIIRFPERAIDLAKPQTFTIRFKYRALDLNKDLELKAKLFVHESAYQSQSVTILRNNQTEYAEVVAAVLNRPNTPVDAVSWGDAVATFTLAPSLHEHPQYLYDAIKIRIESDQTFEGQLAVDMVSVQEDGIELPLVNASFTEGHKQLSGGDSAATFLSRLNGTAFWGNISHHGSEGHSFDSHPYETLIYFLRGLPLGDAVWFAENSNSGIFYGDPLFSPIAVHLHYLPSSDPSAPKDHFVTTASPLVLYGDTLNGTGPHVSTTYSVDYCHGDDFLVCDQNGQWLQIANLQDRAGGDRNMQLGSWDMSMLPDGDYTVRLSVTSYDTSTDYSQTFYDYYTITLFGPGSDKDSDGLSYAEETGFGTNPWNRDTDADMLLDGWEVKDGLDPLTPNAVVDRDGDDVADFIEYLRQSDPTDPGSVPDVSTHRVDPIEGADDGQSPFRTLDAAVAVAEAGDTILLAAGDYSDRVISLTKPVYLEGPADKSAVIQPTFFKSTSDFQVVIRNLVVQTSEMLISGPALSFRNNVFLGDTTVQPGSVLQFSNNIFTAAKLEAIDVQAGATVMLNNSTITNNATGVRASEGSEVLIKNSIITGNTEADLIGVPPASVSYSLIADPAYAGRYGNINADPLFVDPSNGDYRLQPASPAVDAGDPASDYSLEPASVVGRVNMGAYGNTATAASIADDGAGGGGNDLPLEIIDPMDDADPLNALNEGTSSLETTVPRSGSESSSGGGGGCTISTKSRIDPAWLLPLLLGYRRKTLFGVGRFGKISQRNS